jgi:hypothetical protein
MLGVTTADASNLNPASSSPSATATGATPTAPTLLTPTRVDGTTGTTVATSADQVTRARDKVVFQAFSQILSETVNPPPTPNLLGQPISTCQVLDPAAMATDRVLVVRVMEKDKTSSENQRAHSTTESHRLSIDVQYFKPSELPVGDFKLNEVLRLIIPETHVKFDPMTYIMSQRFRDAIKRLDMWSLVDWPLFCEILMAKEGDPLDAERVNWEMEVAKCANRSVVVLTAMLARDNVAAFKLELCNYLTQVDMVNKAEFMRSGGKELNALRNGSGTTAASAVTH